MVIAPNNEIILLNVPIEIDNKNQLTFANANTQFQYFRYISDQKQYDKVTYIRKDGYVVINDCFDNLIKYNYAMYQNENFSSKWYYAFILKVEWLSPNSSKVYLATDVFQTYQFDVDYKVSFIEREMINVANDVPGANLIPESLEIGEVIENASSSINGLGICYAIAYAEDPEEFSGVSPTLGNGSIVNGIVNGIWFYIGNRNKILQTLRTINNAGHGGDVIAVFSIPSVAVYDPNSSMSISDYDNPAYEWGVWLTNGHNYPGREFTLNSTPSSINGYTPRNKKLLQYPFCYLGFTPTNGSQKIFRYEDFENGTPSFKMISEVNPNPSVYVIPKNYKGISGVNISESGIINGYPNVSYHTDFFSNWLAQNGDLVKLNIDRLNTNYDIQWNRESMTSPLTLKMMKQASRLDFLGMVGNKAEMDLAAKNHAFDIKQQMLQAEKQDLMPNTANMGGSNATLLGYEYMNSDVFTRYSIKRQFAERIDLYFDMYGYQTNTLKLPNLNNRPNWNYVKTLGLNILQKSGSNVPQEDLQTFKDIFDEGITLWHNPATFLDYSQNNR